MYPAIMAAMSSLRVILLKSAVLFTASVGATSASFPTSTVSGVTGRDLSVDSFGFSLASVEGVVGDGGGGTLIVSSAVAPLPVSGLMAQYLVGVLMY